MQRPSWVSKGAYGTWRCDRRRRTRPRLTQTESVRMAGPVPGAPRRAGQQVARRVSARSRRTRITRTATGRSHSRRWARPSVSPSAWRRCSRTKVGLTAARSRRRPVCAARISAALGSPPAPPRVHRLSGHACSTADSLPARTLLAGRGHHHVERFFRRRARPSAIPSAHSLPT